MFRYFLKKGGLFLATISLVACGKNAVVAPVAPKPITVAQAAAQDVPLYLEEIGVCTAYESVNIVPQVSGPITEIHFTDGQDVKKGDPLFTIDPRPYQAALDKTKATLAQDQAKLINAQSQYKRTLELSKTKVVAAQELDIALSNADAAAGTVQGDQAAVETAQINLGYCSIVSPIDGRTSKRMVDAGNVVTANTTQLLLIQRQDPIYVDFIIPEGALPKVRKFIDAGTLNVKASFADDPTKSREGKFNFLDSGVQAATGTVRMRAILENNDRLFWPGQFVNVQVVLDILKGAVLIPDEALQIGAKGPFVYVVKGDAVEMRSVKPGQRQGQKVVITEGINDGETVVTTGQISLSPGAKVQIVKDGKGA